jgi:serine/threonine protein kinase
LIDGRYRVQSRLAAGATSEVFVARDENLGRPVALKVLRGETGDRRRFDAEMRLLASLDHPNLVRVYDAVDGDGLAVLVMELVDGPSLAQRLELGPLSDEQVRRLGAELAATLAYLHRRGVVHRDVKPANILLGRDGRARLADFGIARLVDATHFTEVGQTIGTFVYMAPEQLADSQVGPPADIYSLGLVLVEALTGRRAFPGPGGEPVVARLARDPDIPDFLPNRWRSLLTAMTARTPAERPTAVDVGRLLGARGLDQTDVFLGAAPTGPPPTVPLATGWQPGPPAPGLRPSRRALAIGALIVAVLVLAVILIVARSGSRQPALPPPASTTIPATTVPPPTTTPSTVPPTTRAPTTTSTAASTACSALQERLQALDAQRRAIEQNSSLSTGARNALLRALDSEQRALQQAEQACGR